MLQLIIILLILVLAGFVLYILLNRSLFDKQIKNEIKNLEILSNEEEFNHTDIQQFKDLPQPVQRYLTYCNVTDQSISSFVSLKHKGSFRTAPGQKWMPIDGEEYFTIKQPGFIWYARLKPMPFFWIQARDRYINGEGRMTVKLWSSFTVGDPKGKELNISSLLRYLFEMPLFPVSFMNNDFIRWETIDAHTAKASIRDHNMEASGIFQFNDEGELTYGYTNDRYMEQNGKFIQQKWSARYNNYQEMNGIRVPSETIVSWDNGEEFQYARFIITDVNYD